MSESLEDLKKKNIIMLRALSSEERIEHLSTKIIESFCELLDNNTLSTPEAVLIASNIFANVVAFVTNYEHTEEKVEKSTKGLMQELLERIIFQQRENREKLRKDGWV